MLYLRFRGHGDPDISAVYPHSATFDQPNVRCLAPAPTPPFPPFLSMAPLFGAGAPEAWLSQGQPSSLGQTWTNGQESDEG